MKSLIRFIARLAVTPILLFSGGILWCVFFLFLGPMAAFCSFLEEKPFSWSEHFEMCNWFCGTPLQRVWGKE